MAETLTAMNGAWNYAGDPDNNPLDAVRVEIGDTDPADPQLRDSEIQHYLNVYGNRGNAAIYAAIACCHVLAAKYARKASKSIGKLQISYSDIAKSYREQALVLQSRAGGVVRPYAGGTNKADKAAHFQDTSAVQPSFTRDMMSVEGANRPLLPD